MTREQHGLFRMAKARYEKERSDIDDIAPFVPLLKGTETGIWDAVCSVVLLRLNFVSQCTQCVRAAVGASPILHQALQRDPARESFES